MIIIPLSKNDAVPHEKPCTWIGNGMLWDKASQGSCAVARSKPRIDHEGHSMPEMADLDV